MQRVSAVVPAAVLAAVLPLVGCGPSNNRPPAPTNAPPASSAGPSQNSADAAGSGNLAPLAPDYPNPAKLLVDDYGSEGEVASAPAKPGNSGLAVTVQESGPELPWVVRIVNLGEGPAELVADTRLLWFEVLVPGKKKATTCKLPDKLGPSEVEPRLRILLAPGEGVMDAFDPRLYCFSEGDQKLLVPGAQIIPHFGWANAPAKKRWKNGKMVEEAEAARPPFVAMARPPKEEAKDSGTIEAEPAAGPATPHGKKHPGRKVDKSEAAEKALKVASISDKELIGNRFALRSEYSAWSRRTDNQKQDTQEHPPGLRLDLVQGSDARSEHNATVQLSIENPSPAAVHVFFRREMVTFEVTGPRGVTLCGSTPNGREPDRQSYLKIESHRKRTFTSRLAELCPLGTFATPGLYLVHARFDAIHSGEAKGLHAFVGPVLSDAPATVRIRVGEAPFLQKHMAPLPAQPGTPETTGHSQPSTVPAAAPVAPEQAAPAPAASTALVPPAPAPSTPPKVPGSAAPVENSPNPAGKP